MSQNEYLEEKKLLGSDNNHKSKVKGYKIIIVLFAIAAVAGFIQYTKAQLYDDGIPILTAENAQSGYTG
jgi:hypothetical protein